MGVWVMVGVAEAIEALLDSGVTLGVYVRVGLIVGSGVLVAGASALHAALSSTRSIKPR
jgi:hypothetical protein